MKKICSLVIAIFMTGVASAEPFSFSNLYIDGFAGINFVNSIKTPHTRSNVNEGYAVGSALGYRFFRFFRLEGEVAYRSNTFDDIVIADIHFPATGIIKSTTAMANGVVQIPLLNNMLMPYCGCGMGERWTRACFGLEPIHTPEETIVFDKFRARDRDLAYQVIVGLTFRVGPKVQAAVEYRYLDSVDTFGIPANQTVDLNVKKYF